MSSANEEEDSVATLDAPPIFAGRWRLEGMIGAGGMGSVYRARDLELNEVVALKVLTHISASALGRFRDEVRLARKVTHRNVARTFDIGEHEGRRFLTMEYVEGHSLRGVLARGRLPVARARDVGRQICAGVAAVHDEGIAHGDLKPENVLVTADGTLKVSDFGLASMIGTSDDEGLRGTPAYMAPEQFAGQLADRRTDAYSLGIILHELFVGRRPQGKGVPSLPDDVPADVRRLIEGCLAWDPSARPESARALLAVLDGDPLAATGSRSSLRPPSQPTPPSIRVGVRPFAIEGPEDQYLAIALGADLVRILGTAPSLEVHANTEGCDALIDGTVRRTGMSLRLSVRVTSAREHYLLWARGAAIPLADALAEVTSIARAIAETLSAKTAERPRLPMTHDPKVLDLYLRARHAEHLSWEMMGTNECELYDQLLAASPDDPLALAGYANALTRQAALVPGSHSRARAMAERAILLAPDLPEAHLAVALNLFTGNAHEDALHAAMRAIARAPSLPTPHVLLGNLLAEVGRVDEGLIQLDLGLAIEPRLTVAWASATLIRARGGRWDEVDVALGRAPRSMLPTMHWLYWLTRMRIALYRNQDEARATATAIAATPFGGLPPLETLGRLANRAATIEEIRASAGPLIGHEESAGRSRALGFTVVAEAMAFLGEEAALAEALVDLDATSTVDIAWFDRCPLFEPYRTARWFTDVRDRVAARARTLEDVILQLGLVA